MARCFAAADEDASMIADVIFSKTCHTSPIVGKPYRVVHTAALRLILAVGELFDDNIVNCINPLPRVMSCTQVLT